MVAQERRSRRAAARLEQKQMALAEDAAQRALPEKPQLAGQPADADAEAGPQSRLSQVPSPSRRPRAQSAKGPAPWAPDGSASTGAGSSYREKLRSNGHTALQRARDQGMTPKPAGDGPPVTVELLKFLDNKPTPATPTASASGGQVQPYSMPPFQQQSPMQGYYFQPVYIQPACYVASAHGVVGCQTANVVTPMFAHGDKSSTGAVGGPSPLAGFEISSEQLEEIARNARQEVYTD